MRLAGHDQIDFAGSGQMILSSVVEPQNTIRDHTKGVLFVTVSGEPLLDMLGSK